MATQRRSIPALNLLKAQHINKIRNYHKPKIAVVQKEISDQKGILAKSIIKDVEEYAIHKHKLSKLLKCESGHSQLNYNNIQVGLGFNPVFPALDKQLTPLKEAEARDLAAVEEWYTRFLECCAGGADTPVFEPDHLKGVSAEYKYYSD